MLRFLTVWSFNWKERNTRKCNSIAWWLEYCIPEQELLIVMHLVNFTKKFLRIKSHFCDVWPEETQELCLDFIVLVFLFSNLQHFSIDLQIISLALAYSLFLMHFMREYFVRKN